MNSPALSLTNGKCIKNLMSHQIFNKKSYGFLLYFTFQGLHFLLLSAFIPYLLELLSILRQKYNPVKIKTDIGGEKKIKREDEIENEIQYASCPERYVTMILTIPAFSLSKLPFRKNKQHLNK